jgi:hypothetical protein
MTSYLLAAVTVLAALGMTAIGDMVSEEVRDRLDQLPHAILRLAAIRLDPDQGSALYEEVWLPDLAYFLRGDKARPVTRLVHGTRYALGILVTARQITRNLHRTAPLAGTARPELRLDGLQSDGGQRPARRTVRHLVLGAHLRRLREQASITREEVAAVIGDSRSGFSPFFMAHKIALMEYGREEFEEGDIADLLTLYGVGPSEDREWLLRMAREANVPGWWNAHSDTLHWSEPYLGLEAAASVIREYKPQFVPGLLQTEDYARAVIRMDSLASEDEVIRRAQARAWRQAILLRQSPPKLWAVVDEGALRRAIGGPEVMRAQLRHLIDMCDHPAVTLQILPFAVGTHRAMHGGVTLLRHAEPDLPDIAYIEQYLGVLYLDKPTEVGSYIEVFEEVCLKAAPAANTKAVLQRHLADI